MNLIALFVMIIVALVFCFYTLRWMLSFIKELLSYPIIKVIIGLIVAYIIYVLFNNLKTTSGFLSGLKVLVGIIVFAVILIGIISSIFNGMGKRNYRSGKSMINDWDFDYEEIDVDYRREKEKYENLRSQLNQEKRDYEEFNRRREEAENEAAKRRGTPVASGSCPHLMILDSGYYQNWKNYRCNISGATFEESHCYKCCYYADYFRQCVYYN